MEVRMYGRLALFVISALVASAVAAGASPVTSSAIPPNGASATFRFSTAVSTPKGRHAAGGTLTIKHTQGRSLTLTVQSDDGTMKTIPLAVSADGTIAPDASAPPSATDQPDAAARAFMADVSLAAHVGMAARKNAPAANFTVPVTLTPVGDGTPIATQLRMTGTMGGAQYAGSTQGSTMTTLPAGGGLDPVALAKSIGVGAIAHHALTPAGAAVFAIVRHHRKKEEKQAAAGPVPDAIVLTVTTHMTSGRFHEIDGT
ncbi:MAG: hypothetical protein JO024_03115, partial [Candidatus Eremiobacteraeota bacterium]|nr:hypothetical protein [Candidatus Eremiobacteraeota bacterium]